MPRQSRGPASSAPKRPAPPAAPARSAPQQPAQARQASSVAAPSANQHAPPPAQQAAPATGGGGGMFANMASTAAGVAVGSSVGHAITGFFGGGSAPAAPADQPVAQTESGANAVNSNYQAPSVCATDVNNFKRCMDDNQGNLTICGWYLDQLKACQSAASQY